MGKWVVKDGNGQDPVLVVETIADGRISIEIPFPGPIVVTPEKAQQLRLIIGAAIVDTHRAE
jgi:hypothetical protein